MLLLTAELQLLSYGSEPAYQRARMHTRTHTHTHTHKTSATLSGLIFRVELIDIKQRLLRYMDQIFTEASLSNDSRLLANVPYLTTPPQGHRPSLPLGSDA